MRDKYKLAIDDIANLVDAFQRVIHIHSFQRVALRQ